MRSYLFLNLLFLQFLTKKLGFTVFTFLLALAAKKITALFVIRVSYNYL